MLSRVTLLSARAAGMSLRSQRTRVATLSRGAVRAFAAAPTPESSGVYPDSQLADVDAAYQKEQAASKDTFEAPVKGSGLSHAAATALFKSASANGTLDEVLDDLAAVSDALEASSDFCTRVFTSKSYSAGDCITVLNWLMGDDLPAWGDIDAGTRDRLIEEEANHKLFADARSHFADVAIGEDAGDFLVDLASQSRLDLVRRATELFQQMVKVSRNEVSVSIVSAVDLTDAQRARIEKVLPKYVESGKEASISYDVDASIMGGVMLHVENSTLDVSAQSLIRDMNEEMAGAASA